MINLLTALERHNLLNALDTVIDNMVYDSELEAYVDTPDFILTLDKSDFLALKRARDKI